MEDDFLKGFMEEIEDLRTICWTNLNGATNERNQSSARFATKTLDDINALANDFSKLHDIYIQIKKQLLNNTRETEIEVTQGMLNESYFTVTKPLKMGLAIHDERPITIQTSVGNFVTKIIQNYNKLQERGLIGKLFKTLDLKAGDKVIWHQISEDTYEIRPIVFK